MSEQESNSADDALAKLTANIDEALSALKRRQTVALCSLTKRKNSIVTLMKNEDNLHQVKTELDSFDELFLNYQDAHNSLCRAIPEEVDKDPEVQRFIQNEDNTIQFRASVRLWITKAESKIADELDHRSTRSRSSRRSRSTTSSRRSHAHEKAKLAALLVERERHEAQQALLQRKQELESEEKKFQLDLEIEKTRARELIFAETGDTDEDDITSQVYAMNKYLASAVHVRPPQTVTEINNQNANVSSNTVQLNNVTGNQTVVSNLDNVSQVSHVSTNQHVTVTNVATVPNVMLPMSAPPIMSSRLAPSPQLFLSTPPGFPAANMAIPDAQPPAPVVVTTPLSAPPVVQQPPGPPVNQISAPPFQQSLISQAPAPTLTALPDTQQTQQMPPQTSVPNVSYLPTPPTWPTNNMSFLDPLQQLVAAMTLPQPEVPKFSNDPTEYTTFMMAFTSRIESRVLNASDRLYYLNQHLEGEARNVISGCLHMSPDLGYIEAKSILQREYGDPHKISISYINKLLSWPNVKLDADLKAFSIFLTKCSKAMSNIPHMEILNHVPNLQAIVSKLPNYLQNKWRDYVTKRRLENQLTINFHDLAQFIHRASETVNDPLFGRSALIKCNQSLSSNGKPSNKPKNTKQQPSKASVFASNSDKPQAKSQNTASKPQKKCQLCQKQHDIEACPDYLNKTIEQRREFLQDKRLCYACFGWNHLSKGCRNKRTCNTCNKKHPTTLHIDNFVPNTTGKTSESENPEKNEEPNSNKPISCGASNANPDESTVLQAIIPVKVNQVGGVKNATTYAFYDSGSSGCFLTEDLYSELEPEGKPTTLTLRTMHGSSNTECIAVEGLVVSSLTDNNAITLPRTFTREQIPVDHSHIPNPDALKKMSHLKEVASKLHPYYPNIKIGLLIGSNCPKAMQPLKVIPSTGDGPFAVQYPHGWTVNGPVHMNYCNNTSFCNRINVQEFDFRENILHLFNQDFNDPYASPDQLGHSRDDLDFISKAESNVELKEGHFELPLPFRDENQTLPNNRVQAMTRTKWQLKKMLNDAKYHEEYTRFVGDLLMKGYARPIAPDEPAADQGKLWYLPHHGVFHPTKKKLRVVFDCSARYNGIALNDCLLKGPDLTNSLIGVLSRFRQDKIAFIGDVEAMFHQVKVIREHQNYLRFLWWPEGDLQSELHEYCMTVHLFGASSSPSIANFALKRTADIAEETCGTKAANTIRRNFYVDDCLRSVSSSHEGIQLIQDVQEACKFGGFRLTKFCSNSSDVLDSIPVEERSKELWSYSLNYDALPSERALGVFWHVNEDSFGYKIEMKDKPCTRRGILSLTSSIYDPLGFVAPYVLRAKSILQDLCREEKLQWDDAVPEEYENRWRTWIKELHLLEDVSISRCFKPPQCGEIISKQLHVFADASSTGYGAVAYYRLVDENGLIHCSFLQGKARVAPLKKTTLPRLELTAATVAVRIGCHMRDELDIKFDQIFYHTDSTTVLHYIFSKTKRFQVFVANRVQFIHEHTEESQWRYVNTKDNPADLASRGMSAEQLLQPEIWFTGPKFLWEPETSWPSQPKLCEDYAPNETCLMSTVESASETSSSAETVHKLLGHYSDWLSLKRAVAYYQKLFRILKAKCTSSDETLDPSLSVDDLKTAETSILRFVQEQCFPTEIKTLSEASDDHISKSSSIYRLDPFMKQGFLRVGGRLSRSYVAEETKHPILLPNKGHVTTLLIQSIHQKLAHAGRNHVLAHLRECYWIIHANAAVRQVLSRCVICRRLRGPMLQQKMADLPTDRTVAEAPFTATGVDFFGPFRIKQGRKELKYYGVIFTCLSSRSVHLEVAASLDTDSFLHALRRFLARRGPISVMRSDNGTNFVGAERELREAVNEINQEQVKNALMKQSISWIFNPPLASHMGGVWERNIRTIRKVLSAMSREFGSILDLESFQTLMCEVEALINSRPLTTVSSDPTDLDALTPSHILTMKSKVILPPPGQFQREDLYLRKRWRKVQHLANVFWTRWRREYLVNLQERQKWCRNQRNLRTGDLVLMKDDFQTRNMWPMARVTGVEEDKRGHVRTVTVRTKTADYRRPVARLVLLLPIEEQ